MPFKSKISNFLVWLGVFIYSPNFALDLPKNPVKRWISKLSKP